MHPNSITVPPSRLPPGSFGHTRGVVKPNYAFIPPEGVIDSFLPNYEKTTVRFLAAPVLGAKFAQVVLEINAGGGTRGHFSDHLQRFFYVLSGTVELSIDGGVPVILEREGYAYLPPNTRYSLRNAGGGQARVIGIKKAYQKIDLPQPEPVVSKRADAERILPGLEGRYYQDLLSSGGDFRFDFEINILSFAPGTYFPHVETHIMEHGLYMLEGQGMYLLHADWHETWTDDFIWMGPYCPQFFYATGWENAAYLLYKNINRDVDL